MSSAPQPPRKRRWPKYLLALLLLAGLAGGTAYLFRDELRDEWALRQFRRAVSNDDPALPEREQRLRERLLRKAEGENLDLAVRLADDTDPKVRAASVDVLLCDQPRAKKQNAVTGASVRFGSWRTRVQEAIKRLLKDPDEAVRKKALQSVSELEWADVFGTELTDALKTGTLAERVIVAGGLANWNGPLLREVIGDANQPDDARIAAMGSLTTYGDKHMTAFRGELRTALVAALKSGNVEVRKSAVVALLDAQQAPAVWLDILCDENQKELHSLALRTWLAALSNDPNFGRHWPETHDAWHRGAEASRRCAVAGYVMCEGAKAQIKLLEASPEIGEMAALRDRTGPTGRAFDVQLRRLGNVLSVVSAVRWYCETVKGEVTLAGWLPHETPAGAPPTRDVKTFLFREAKPIWEWCLAREGAYPTRFLGPNTIVRSYGNKTTPRAKDVLTLGELMDELLLDRGEYDKLRVRYDGK